MNSTQSSNYAETYKSPTPKQTDGVRTLQKFFKQCVETSYTPLSVSPITLCDLKEPSNLTLSNDKLVDVMEPSSKDIFTNEQQMVGGTAQKSKKGDRCDYRFPENAQLTRNNETIPISGKNISVPYGHTSDADRNRLLSSLSDYYGKPSFVLEDALLVDSSEGYFPPYLLDKMKSLAVGTGIEVRKDSVTGTLQFVMDTQFADKLSDPKQALSDLKQSAVNSLFTELKEQFKDFTVDKLDQPIRGLFTYTNPISGNRHTDCIECTFTAEKKVKITYFSSASLADTFLTDIQKNLPGIGTNCRATQIQQSTMSNGDVALYNRADPNGPALQVRVSNENMIRSLATVMQHSGYQIESLEITDARTLSYHSTQDCVPSALDQIFNDISPNDIAQESDAKRGIRLRATQWAQDAFISRKIEDEGEAKSQSLIPFESSYASNTERAEWYISLKESLLGS